MQKISVVAKKEKKNRGSYKEILREQRGHKTIYIYLKNCGK